MRRRASPSARTTRTAPTAPASRSPATALVCLARSRRVAGPVTGNGSCTSVEGGPERSTGSPGGPRDSPSRRTDDPTPASDALAGDRGRAAARARRAGVYSVTYVDRYYDHFVWQAAAFLEGQAAIRYPVEAAGGLLGQRLLPGRPADRHDRRRRRAASCRSRRCRRWSSLPFVAVWGLAADDQAIFTVLAAIDVGDLLVGARAAAGQRRRPPRHDGLLRLRDGLLVHGPDRHDLVPGPHRRGRADASWPIGIAVGADPGVGRDETTAPDDRRRPATPAPNAPEVAPSARRATPVPRRAPVRSGLHGAPDGRLRRPFFAFVGAGRRLAAAELVGRARRGDPDPRAGRSTTSSRPGTSSIRPTTTSTASRRGYPTLGYHPDWARRGSALPAAEPRDRAVRHAGHPPVALPESTRRPADAGLRRPPDDARPVRPGLPAGRPARHGDERDPDQPGLPPRAPGPAALRAEPAGHRRGPRGRASSRSST